MAKGRRWVKTKLLRFWYVKCLHFLLQWYQNHLNHTNQSLSLRGNNKTVCNTQILQNPRHCDRHFEQTWMAITSTAQKRVTTCYYVQNPSPGHSCTNPRIHPVTDSLTYSPTSSCKILCHEAIYQCIQIQFLSTHTDWNQLPPSLLESSKGT